MPCPPGFASIGGAQPGMPPASSGLPASGVTYTPTPGGILAGATPVPADSDAALDALDAYLKALKASGVPLDTAIPGIFEPPGSTTPANDVQAALIALAKLGSILPAPTNATGDGYAVPASAGGMLYVDSTGKLVLDKPEYILVSGAAAATTPWTPTPAATTITFGAAAGTQFGTGTWSGGKYTIATKGLYTAQTNVVYTGTSAAATWNFQVINGLTLTGSQTPLVGTFPHDTESLSNDASTWHATYNMPPLLMLPGDTIEPASLISGVLPAGVTASRWGIFFSVAKIRSIP
jgi:hypothetical protein